MKEKQVRPKVSIIVPIYNTAKYLDRCILSILNQTLKEIEIILVDDESPDDAPVMCEEYAKKDKRIKVIHKKNGGLGLARNSGMKIATGEYVAFLDSDDYVLADMYEKLYICAKKHNSDTCFCGCGVDYGNHNIEKNYFALGECYYNNNSDILKNILYNALGAKPEAHSDNVLGMQVWRGLYSLDLIKENKIKFCSERDFICEDAIFHIDYFQYSNRFSAIPDALYIYCVYGVSLSRIYRKDRFDKNIVFYIEEKRRLRKAGILQDAKCYIDRMLLALIRGNMRDAVFHMPFGEAVTEVKKMMSNYVVRDVIQSYPIRKNPIKWRFFNYLIYFKVSVIATLMLKILDKR